MRNWEAGQILQTDVLVIGGGGAGMRAAIEAARLGCQVIVVDKGPVGRSGTTPMAMEAIQSVCTPGDSPELHFRDAVEGERYLGDENLIAVMVCQARQRMQDLEAYGARFKRKADGSFDPMHHPGQSFPRTLFIQGGGFGMLAALVREARKHPEIQILSDVLVMKLSPDRAGIPSAAVCLDLKDGGLKAILCKAVILATGGYEELWAFSDASSTACGDGVFLAYEIGAKLVDLEMVQFYPTVIIHPPSIKGILFQYELIVNPEVLGGRLLNGKGNPFFEGMPLRDDIIRAIWKEIQRGRGTEHGGVFIDLVHSSKSREALTEALEKWQPNQFHYLKDMGFDLRNVLVEAGPHVHFTMGGVAIDERARTTVPGLFAAGEVAGNLHGANRISGNSLTETQVFGALAGVSAAHFAATRGRPGTGDLALEMDRAKDWLLNLSSGRRRSWRPLQVRQRLQEIMWNRCGIERDAAGLLKAKDELEELKAGTRPFPGGDPSAAGSQSSLTWGAYPQELQEELEIRMMISLSELILDSALFRQESRGHHIRTDYPHPSGQAQHTFLAKAKGLWAGDVSREDPAKWKI